MRISTLLRSSALATLLLASVPACDLGDNPPALVVLGNQVPEKTNEGCFIRSGGGQKEFRLRGLLDLAVGTRYTAFLSLQNNFPTLQTLSGFQPGDARLESGTITLTHANLRYRIAEPALLEAFGNHTAAGTIDGLGIALTTDIPTSVNVSATLPPQTSQAIQVDLIPSNHGQLLRGLPGLTDGGDVEIVVEAEVVGTRADGSEVRSGTFAFPVTLCGGCSVAHAYAEAVASRPFTHPSLDQPLTADDIGTPCFAGNDEGVTNAFCGAVWGPESAGGGNTCRLNRCFGKGGDVPGTLICTTDVPSIPAPAP